MLGVSSIDVDRCQNELFEINFMNFVIVQFLFKITR